MKKFYVVATALFALLTYGGANADADAMVGVDAGFAEVDGFDDNGTEFGVFGRFMSVGPDETGFGLHLGYSQNSAEDSVTVGNVTLEGEVENIADVLLVLRTAADDSELNALFMFGYSSAKIEVTGTVGNASASDSDSADGWKLAAGIERPISETAVLSFIAHIADYGDAEFFGIEAEVGSTFGVRAGIALRF